MLAPNPTAAPSVNGTPSPLPVPVRSPLPRPTVGPHYASDSAQTPAPAAPQASLSSDYGPLSNDPGLIAALNQQKANDAAAQALLNSLRQTALYQYSGSGNPYSTLAQLKQQDADNTRAYINNLAARGILHSGETGYQAGQEAKRYGLATYTAQNALNDLLNQAQQNYLATLGQDASGVTNALGNAWTNYNNNPDPKVYGYWNNGTLPSGEQGFMPINPNDPYQNPTSGGSWFTTPGIFK